VKVLAAELAPAAALRGDLTRASELQRRRGDPGEGEGERGAPDGLEKVRHRGASWNRTSDLTLIRGAL
jgi:hypothetical protein